MLRACQPLNICIIIMRIMMCLLSDCIEGNIHIGPHLCAYGNALLERIVTHFEMQSNTNAHMSMLIVYFSATKTW